MAAKKKVVPRKEIRIVDPSSDVWNMVVKLAKKEKRTIGKQAEYMLYQYIENLKYPRVA